MKVTLHFNLPLQQRLQRDSISIELPIQATLREAIMQMVDQLPQTAKQLFLDAQHCCQPFTAYVIDKKKVDDPNKHSLKENDQITVLMPMAGG